MLLAFSQQSRICVQLMHVVGKYCSNMVLYDKIVNVWIRHRSIVVRLNGFGFMVEHISSKTLRYEFFSQT